MNYCPRCGAYIPEGFDECLACGYSILENKQADAGQSARPQGHGAPGGQATATAQAPDPAEYHQAHKKAEGNKTEEYEYGTETKDKTKRKFDKATEEMRDASEYQSVSYLSYLGPLCFIPYFFCGNSPFARFHAWQGIRLFVLELIVNACWGMGLFGVMAGLAGSVLVAWCVLNGFLNVSQKKKRRLPVIGNLFS